MTQVLTELGGHAKTIFEALAKEPKGMSVEDLMKETGLSVNQVWSWTGMLQKWSPNIKIKRRGRRENGGRIQMAYYPPGPSVVVAAPSTIKVSAKDQTGAAAVQPVPSSQGTTKTTDIAWAAAPPMVDPAEKYAFFNPPEFYRTLRSKVLVHGKNIAMKGPPGIGKSSAWEYMAATEYRVLVNINADAGLKARQLIGGLTDLGRFEVAQFATAVVQGWWAKIDEANGMDPDAALALNSLLAPPYMITIHGKNYPVHPEFRLCITYNPGLVGTKPLPDSLKDRFYPIVVGFPTEGRLRIMLKANGVDTSMPDVERMIKFAMEVSKLRDSGKLRFDITMRRLIDAWSDLQDGSKLYDALMQSVVAAIDNRQDIAAVMTVLDSTVGKSSQTVNPFGTTP